MTMSTTVAESPSSAFLSPKAWLVLYALMVSAIYLWGYWGTFGINVLDYLRVSDIIKAAVYPVVSAFAFMAIGALLGEVLSPRPEPSAGANTSVAKVLRKAAPLATLHWSWRCSAGRTSGISYQSYLPLLRICRRSPSGLLASGDSFGRLPFHRRLPGVSAVLVRSWSRKQANEVIDSATYQVVVSELPMKASGAKLNFAEKPRSVGKLGDRFAMYDPVARSVSLIAATELKVRGLARGRIAWRTAVRLCHRAHDESLTSCLRGLPCTSSNTPRPPS
jgi:hypothetical protein